MSMEMSEMQTHISDEIPLDTNHVKMIHAMGVVAQMSWASVGDHPYTGMFKGGTHGLVRYSIAADADYTVPFVAPGTQPANATNGMPFGPGGGFKLLRDGTHSANFVAITPNGADGQNSYNFFKQPWITHVGAPDVAVLKDKFSTASPVIDMVGLKDFASADQQGVREDSPAFPFMLELRPAGNSRHLFPDSGPTSNGDVLEQLCSLPAGAVMHDVYAQDSPGASMVLIGHIKLASSPVTSKWGDERLFFRHGQMLDDLEDHPEWLEGIPNIQGRSSFFSTCPFVAQHNAYEAVCSHFEARQAKG